MQLMKVWEFVDLPEGFKPIDCKCIFKTKKDSEVKIKSLQRKTFAAKGVT